VPCLRPDCGTHYSCTMLFDDYRKFEEEQAKEFNAQQAKAHQERQKLWNTICVLNQESLTLKKRTQSVPVRPGEDPLTQGAGRSSRRDQEKDGPVQGGTVAPSSPSKTPSGASPQDKKQRQSQSSQQQQQQQQAPSQPSQQPAAARSVTISYPAKVPAALHQPALSPGVRSLFSPCVASSFSLILSRW